MSQFFQDYATNIVPYNGAFPDLQVLWGPIGEEGVALLGMDLIEVESKLAEVLQMDSPDEGEIKIQSLARDEGHLKDWIADILGGDRAAAESLANEIVASAQIPAENSNLTGIVLKSLGASGVIAQLAVGGITLGHTMLIIGVAAPGIFVIGLSAELAKEIAKPIGKEIGRYLALAFRRLVARLGKKDRIDALTVRHQTGGRAR